METHIHWGSSKSLWKIACFEEVCMDCKKFLHPNKHFLIFHLPTRLAIHPSVCLPTRLSINLLNFPCVRGFLLTQIGVY